MPASRSWRHNKPCSSWMEFLVMMWIVPVLLLVPVFPFSSSSSRPIPITVLSGFLGSGKTSLLQHLLENQQGLRIAVIVNDVASVNIDSKLVASSSAKNGQRAEAGDSNKEGGGGLGTAAEMVELQNGCACCSLSEELLASVSELVTLSDLRGDEQSFHHIVIEMSGVADPKSVRAKFQEALLYDMPLMERVQLDTMVTVVDCSTFLANLRTERIANPDESPELFYRDGEKPPPKEEWMEQVPAPLLAALMSGGSVPIEGTDNGVTDLLVSQTETSDVILLNKVDLAEEENNDMNQIEQIVRALNPKATLCRSSFGQVDPTRILGVAGAHGVVEAGVVDDHRDAVKAASTQSAHQHEHEHHDHSNENSYARSHQDTTDSTEIHIEHDHKHEHSHHASPSEHSHEHHSHEHNHEHTSTDASHGHSHEHSHSCDDPNCTDPTHDHSHSHNSNNHATIGSFVFRARRPFHPRRLAAFLRHLPVKRGVPTEDEADQGFVVPEEVHTALQRVMRSKGFTWCADSNIAALFWSQAGTSFDMQCLGRWWATLPREQWPPEAVETLLSDFDDPTHHDGVVATDTVGDRRQEIVFIGAGLGAAEQKERICRNLEKCLLDDSEWVQFQQRSESEERLKATFANAIETRMATY